MLQGGVSCGIGSGAYKKLFVFAAQMPASAVDRVVAATAPETRAQVVAFQPHPVRFAGEVAQHGCFRVVIAHARDIQRALLAFGGFAYRARHPNPPVR